MAKSDLKELGTAQVLINKVTNTVDGGAKITLDFNPDDIELIKKLFQKALRAELTLVTFIERNGD